MLFTAFGDSTLSFKLRFWVDVTKANSAQISSDLRLMIADAFAENGIVIDFPQRDIHLHAASPIQVQVVPPPGDGRASDLGLPNKAKASNNSGEMLPGP